MKVVYSVATNFGGSGIGTTSYQAGLGIFRSGYLQKVFCSSQSLREIPGNLLYPTHVSFFEGLPFLPSSYQWLLKDVAHDLITAVNLPRVIKESNRTLSRRRDEADEAVNRLDIFHVWNGHGLSSLRVAKKFGAGIVVERASSHPETFARIMDREYRRRGLRFGQMLGFNKKRLLREFAEADFMTVPSDFAFQSMIENGVPEGKLTEIPFGVDVSKFRPALTKPSSTFNVLFAGQVGLRKGVLYLLEAWQKLGLPEAVLTVVGQPDSEVKRFLESYRHDPSIRFLGYSDLLPLYQASDLFVFPSLEEGSALVTYEALACGLPVITTLEAGSVVREGSEGFLVPAAEVNSLAEKIKYLYENPSRRQTLSENARRRAQEHTWVEYGRRLVSFYEKIT